MADDAEQPEGAVPPPTEEVHLPDPSYLPAVVALGIAIMIVGVIMTWVIVVIGALFFVPALVIWIRRTREEISHLPLEH